MRIRRKLRVGAIVLALGSALAVAPVTPVAPASATGVCRPYDIHHYICRHVHAPKLYDIDGNWLGVSLPWSWEETLVLAYYDSGVPNGQTAPWDPHPGRWILVDEAGYHGWISDSDVYDETDTLPPLFGQG